jgi:hypothetical protein
MSIVVRNEDDEGLVAQLDVEVWFTNSNGDGVSCATDRNCTAKLNCTDIDIVHLR